MQRLLISRPDYSVVHLVGMAEGELMSGIVVGFGLGFLVALQLGPMSLFLIRSTLRSGLRIGLAIGGGIAAVDALYASLGSAGAAPLMRLDPVRIGLGVCGAAVLLFLGTRTLLSALHVRAGVEAAGDVASARSAFVTSLAATASNPATVLSWAALFAAASSATGVDPIRLVVGVGLGSLTWVTTLACSVAAVRHSIGAAGARVADGLAGLGLLAFGGAMSYATLHETR
jgi:putative LysE/RhtB family amino acid efflux pump